MIDELRDSMNTSMSISSTLPDHSLSIVVPMHNEMDNVAPLVKRVEECLGNYPWPWELILVDDGSTDGTREAIEHAAQQSQGFVRLVELARNFKQTAAMQAGIDAARADVIVTMDGDLQNDPVDIPRMVARLLNEELDLVAGWRKDRKDNMVMRKIPSQIANALIARMTGIALKDNGCSLKVFRASTLKRVRLYGEMHRFIPAWLSTVTSSKRIAEEVVTHHPRIHGESKYGISRTFRVLLDLFFVYFFMRYRARPGHFFGGIWPEPIGCRLFDLELPLIRQVLLRRRHWYTAFVVWWFLLGDCWRANVDDRHLGRSTSACAV
jgi:glycosyltransferase involved in cell wall biosynthesis